MINPLHKEPSLIPKPTTTLDMLGNLQTLFWLSRCGLFAGLFLVSSVWMPSVLMGQVPLANRINGDLRYDHAVSTPLAGVPVVLKTMLGNTVASDTTDSSGAYSLSGFANGTYILDALPEGNWGGVNATDALQINRHFTSLLTLSPLRQMAADVNVNQAINSADALLVNRRITGLTTAFGAGNWVSDRPSLTAQGTPVQINLRMLCVGDVNGSYAPIPVAPVITQVTDRIFSLCRASTTHPSRCTPGRPSNKACRIAAIAWQGNSSKFPTLDTLPFFKMLRLLRSSTPLSIPDESVAFDKPDKIGFRGVQRLDLQLINTTGQIRDIEGYRRIGSVC